MAYRYQIVSSTADGEYTLPRTMSADYERAYACIAFYSDQTLSTQVTPTDGIVEITLSPDGVNYYTIDGGTFEAKDCYKMSRTKPSAASTAVQAKVQYYGIEGASHAVVTIERY